MLSIRGQSSHLYKKNKKNRPKLKVETKAHSVSKYLFSKDEHFDANDYNCTRDLLKGFCHFLNNIKNYNKSTSSLRSEKLVNSRRLKRSLSENKLFSAWPKNPPKRALKRSKTIFFTPGTKH